MPTEFSKNVEFVCISSKPNQEGDKSKQDEQRNIL